MEHTTAEKNDAIDAALHVAVVSFADALDLHCRGADRVPAMICLYKQLGNHLKRVPDRERKLLNDEFANQLLMELGEVPPDSPPGTKGVLKLNVARKGEMVALEYTEKMVICLPPDTARTLAQALCHVARVIDGQEMLLVDLRPKEGKRNAPDRPI